MEWIKATYADAIEYVGAAKDVRGLGITFGVFAAAVGGVIADSGIWALHVQDWFVVACGILLTLGGLAFGSYMLLWMMRWELFRPNDEPTIFDRKRRKVYRISREAKSGFKGLLQRWPLQVLEYDWDLVEAEHRATLVTTGSTAYRQHELWFLVKQSATDSTVIDTFRIGNVMAMSDGITDGVWEHIRRFMEEGGPHLPGPDEPLADRTVPQSWWESMGAIGLPFGPKYLHWWKTSPMITLMHHLVLPLTLPMSLLWGTGNWLSYKTQVPVTWPDEVLAALGPVQRGMSENR
ncbi:hypothetical protein OOT46_03940 [Aquabacterium sp. A7-Y]|uniref:DUF6708 domain-containing protein n=1 Tax=Aquabacterium sp. A7-Y TaxID=1349605 RepID=UPI00223DC73B|nr:DUF6708 domain-containing protein [Aquabacterium sp. A7-Y]MCW7537005.1 hypothetical protein [Aquabacterium sp. A7-Y]